MIVDRRRVEKALPGYRVGDQLGSGQFGLVLAARHRRLRRPVAVKVMRAEDPEGPEDPTVDFAAEGQILADLDHPHVVRIFEYVEAEGLCLVVMELLAGGTLTRRQGTLTSEQACAVALAVAAALEHAHTRGVLHRDIKPDNILFAADNTVKVADFGIAKILEGTTATASGRAGTPMYMAPEQIIGGRLGPATDLYALGIVLYQLLTGRPPFDPRQPLQTLWHQHLTDPPPPMHGVPTDIAAVVLQALAKDPADRHPDATAFAFDLAHATTGAGWTTRAGMPLHLDNALRRVIDPRIERENQARMKGDEQEEAVPFLTTWDPPPKTQVDTSNQIPATARSRTWRTGAYASAAAAILVVSLLAWSLPSTDIPSAETVSGRLATEATAIAADQPDLARRLAVAAYRTAPTAQARTTVLRLLTTDQPAATLTGLTDTAMHVAFSPDGTLLATSSPEGGTAQVWDATARGEVRPLATLTGPVGDVVFSPDGTRLAASSQDGTARIWDATARGEVPPLATLTGHTARVNDVVFSPDGTRLAASSQDGTARIWDATARGEVPPLATLTGHTSWADGVVFSPDGTLLATSSSDGTAKVWDATARGEVRPLATLIGRTSGVFGGFNSVAFNPDGTRLATAGDDGITRVWDATARGEVRPLATLGGHTGDVNSVVFSPDGTLLATSSSDGTAKVWDATARGEVRPLATLTGHTNDVQDVVFSPDGTLLATSSSDGTAKVWDATARGEVPPLAALPNHNGPTNNVAFSPDGALFATNDSDATTKVWNVDAGRLAGAACAEETNRLTEAEWKAVLPKIPYSAPCP